MDPETLEPASVAARGKHRCDRRPRRHHAPHRQRHPRRARTTPNDRRRRSIFPTWGIASPKRRAHIARVTALALSWANAMNVAAAGARRMARCGALARRDARCEREGAPRDRSASRLAGVAAPRSRRRGATRRGWGAARARCSTRSTGTRSATRDGIAQGACSTWRTISSPERKFDREMRAELAARVPRDFDGAFREVVSLRLGSRVASKEKLLAGDASRCGRACSEQRVDAIVAESSRLMRRDRRRSSAIALRRTGPEHAAIRARDSPGNPQPASSAKLTDPKWATGTRITVEVLNATKVRGLARRAARALRDQGFDVVSTGTNKEQFDSDAGARSHGTSRVGGARGEGDGRRRGARAPRQLTLR